MLKHLDAILIPVGGYYTIDAVQAKALADDLAPRVCDSDALPFRPFWLSGDRTSQRNLRDSAENVVEYDSNALLLTAETRPQTAVLKL